jgi:hypothetical protein
MLIVALKSIVLAVLITIIVLFLINAVPVSEHIFKSSTKAQCSNLSVGMAHAQVNHAIEGRIPPRYESMQSDHMEFSNFADGVCKVYFDDQKDRVKSVQFESVSAPKWNLRGD